MGRFNLNKGDRFKLDKSAGLSKIQIDLGWKLRPDMEIDLDISAFLLGADGVISEDADFVFYNSENRSAAFDRVKFGNKRKWKEDTFPVSVDGSVQGSIDDKGNDEEREDAEETMHVDLDKVNGKITEIVFVATIYHGDEEGTTFGDVPSPFISIINEKNGEELCRYALNEKFASETAVVAGSLVSNEEGEWSFEAIGKGYEGGLNTLIDIYA